MSQKKIKEQRRKQREIEKRLAAKKPNRNYKKYWMLGIGGLVSIGIAGLVATVALRSKPKQSLKKRIENIETTDQKEISYSEARKNRKIRYDYIRQLAKRYPPPIKDVDFVYYDDKEYYPNPLFDSGGMYTRTYFIALPGTGVAQDIQLEVYRGAFNQTQNEDEFLNLLVDHEYRHIELLSGSEIEIETAVFEEFNRRVINITGDLFEAYQELHAYSAQINAFSKRPNLRGSFKRKVRETYSIYRKVVEEKKQTPLTRFLLEEFPKY